MSLETSIQGSVQHLSNAITGLKGWYYKIKERDKPLTNNERIFLEGLQINSEEQSLYNHLLQSLQFPTLVSNRMKICNQLRFNCSVGAYETLQKCQPDVSYYVRKTFEEYKQGYQQSTRPVITS